MTLGLRQPIPPTRTAGAPFHTTLGAQELLLQTFGLLFLQASGDQRNPPGPGRAGEASAPELMPAQARAPLGVHTMARREEDVVREKEWGWPWHEPSGGRGWAGDRRARLTHSA